MRINSFRSTINNSNHLGRSVSEIASKLLMLGNVYDVDVSDEDFYALDRLHNVLLEVYGGPYPLADILASVCNYFSCRFLSFENNSIKFT